jgi:hypothetical protein
MVALSGGHGELEAFDCSANIRFQSPSVMISHQDAQFGSHPAPWERG